MAEQTNTYVTVYYPGSFYAEESVHLIKKRDPKAVAKSYPACFAFQFYDLVETEVVVGGERKNVSTKPRNKSPKYFPGGTLMDAEQVAKSVPDSSILVSNMRCNGWDQIIKTRRGNFQPFEKNCEIL